MYSIWECLKESTSCSSRRSDVHQPSRRASKGTYERVKYAERRNPKRELLLLKRQDSQKDYTQDWFYELSIGDPSRNVIETIFRTAYMNQSKHVRKIERVLRVKNSTEALEKFEEYREAVKKRAYEYDQQMKHPRILVDGNELLLFYSTAMTCCSRKRQKVSKLCRNHTCGVCGTIQSGFGTDKNTMSKEIQLSTTVDTRSDAVCIGKGCNVKKAVVVCRVIAGRVASKVEGGSEEEFDSVGSKGFCSKLEHLFVWNSNAVLPCFAIVYI